MVKRGVTRVVVLWRRWAFKLPNPASWRQFLQGLLCNMTERDFSTLGDPQLCPVVFAVPGGWLTVMRRAEPVSDHPNARLLAQMIEVTDRYHAVELKRCSFGWLDGRLVAVDYG